jgi:hypothetical protein
MGVILVNYVRQAIRAPPSSELSVERETNSQYMNRDVRLELKVYVPNADFEPYKLFVNVIFKKRYFVRANKMK